MLELEALALILQGLAVEHRALADLYDELALAVDPTYTADIDTLTLARAIQGEEAGQFGERRDELGELIAHTAVNRWEKPWWKQIDGEPCTFARRIEIDWHGTALVDTPEPWAVRIAARVLASRRAGGEDKADGALFAMTLDDLKRHAWTYRAHEALVNTVISTSNPLVQFWFMTDHPANPQEATQ